MFPLRQLKREDYTIAWLCALPQSESLAAQWMLDEQHDPPPQHKTDMNEYQYGSIKSHNIVIACMPETMPGHVSATLLAASLQRDFSNVALHLFVGIGGGIPRPKTEPAPRTHEEDVFLGDVVLGLPQNGEDPAVVSYDLRRTHQRPDRAIVAKLGTFFRNAKQGGTHFDEHLRRLDRLHGFGHPGRGNDLLYEADFPCKHSKDYMDVRSMCGCGRERLVTRKERRPPGTQLVFHRGTICSANRFMADAETRDAMRKEYPTARCFEMEAAGVIDTHALVIRGITDYSDSHSNKRWQNYAAGAAAALTREIIVNMAPMESPGSSQIDKNNEHARCFAYNSIEMSEDRFVNRKGEVWEQMTVRGLSIYEIIYLECAEGSRRVTKEKLKQRFPPQLQERVSQSWDLISRKAEYLHKGMTLAVIYVVHLQDHFHERLSKFKYPEGRKGSERRDLLRHYGVWIQCNCDSYCPCLWNFANRLGLCRNPVETCKAQQLFKSAPPADYGSKQFEALRKKWIGTPGDPCEERSMDKPPEEGEADQPLEDDEPSNIEESHTTSGSPEEETSGTYEEEATSDR